MHNIIFILILLMSSINADAIWNLGQKSPSKISSLKLSSYQTSPNGSLTASLYTANNRIEEGESQKQYLQIGTVAKKWWLSNTLGFMIISKIHFIDNRYLLTIQNSTTVTLSTLIDTKTKEQRIFGGTAEYITEGENKGLFVFHDSKGYLPAPEYGAFWVDKVRNKQGELIEVLSKAKNSWGCIPLRLLLNQKETYPSLRQSMEDCVYVDR